MDDAEQKAGETDGSMRVFKLRGDANTFRQEKKSEIKGSNKVTPQAARRSISNAEPDGGEVATNRESRIKLGNEKLKEMFKKKMMDKAGNKIIVNYLEIPGKTDVIVILDFCRETRDGDGEIIRKVNNSTHNNRVPLIFK